MLEELLKNHSKITNDGAILCAKVSIEFALKKISKKELKEMLIKLEKL